MNAQAADLVRKARTRRRLGFGALVVIALLFGAMVVNSFRAADERRNAENWHLRTLDILLVAGDLETAVNEALRGERGYQITDNRAFLEPYREGRDKSIRLLRQLREMTPDNPIQQRYLALVERRQSAFLGTLSYLIALHDAGREAEATAAVRSGVSRRHITDLLAALGTVQTEEQRLLVQRRAATLNADARAEAYGWTLAALGALMLALLAAALFGAARAHQLALALTVELGQLATTDVLTGLPNRRHLMTEVETEIARARRSGRPLALALLDIDHFKSINDRHGHPAGDAALREVAEVLRTVTRIGDLLGRFGGEEFVVLMPDTRLDQAEFGAERLRKAIEARIMRFPGGGTGRVTVSTGVALLAGDEGCDQLVSRADGALYEAKAEGRNLVRLAA